MTYSSPEIEEKFNAHFVDKMLADNLAETWVEITKENERLRKLLNWWLDSSIVDVTMQGPVFKGVSMSRSDVWKATIDELRRLDCKAE